MVKISEETKNSISNQIQRCLGITYEEYIKLDFEEQQKLLQMYHKNNKSRKNDSVRVMVGMGENSTFMKTKKGNRVMIGSGEDSCFINAGTSLEESRNEIDDKIDDVIYNKPVAFVKKLQRKLKK